MARKRGNQIVLKLETVVVNGVLSKGLDTTVDMIEVTEPNDGAEKSFIAGDITDTIPVEGIYDVEHTYGYDDMMAAARARTPIAFVFGGTDAGDVTYSGNCLISNLSKSAPRNDKISWTGSLQVTGGLTTGAVGA